MSTRLNARAAPLMALITRTRASTLLQTAPSTLLALLQRAYRIAPKAAKYIALALLVLNAGSFPLAWHFQVFSSVFELRLALQWHKITHFYLSKSQKKEALRDWFEAHLPIGVHPFRAQWAYRKRVGFDDSDFNLHMSNSSYAKALDSARFRLALATFPSIFRTGGWVPLAATHFYFIREIPMLTTYEVRCEIGAWDGKWIWYICRFVKPPSKNSKSKSNNAARHNDSSAPHLVPTLKTPATPLLNGNGTGASTPAAPPPHLVNGNSASKELAEADAISRALLARAAARTTEPDGALLYTVSVSQLCYKQGRITVPPAVVLASNGFYAGSSPPSPSSLNSTSTSTGESGTGEYIKPTLPASFGSGKGDTRPRPPYWDKVRELAESMPRLGRFFAGGWRDVPEGERWWEEAFAGCESERRERLVPFVGGELAGGDGGSADGRIQRGGLSGGLEGVRNMWGGGTGRR
ncbi:peptidase A1 domain-containing protein [Favolaschia claudopus]|uniref:Peptidase A1 domain-containing protein n=1 Tax=Favolaschia claudopus TaxID=2862362 RepID=A0AAW0A7V3_9AGAR